MPSDYEFRKVLLKVANGLSKTDYERLLFLLDDDIPKPKQEESIVAVFNHLISVGLISDGDTTYLQNSLREIGFIKLAFELARYDNKRSPREMLSTTTATTESTQPEDSTPLSNTLSTNSSREVGILVAMAQDYQDLDRVQLTNYEIIEPIMVTSTIDRNISIESQPDSSPISLEDSDIEIFAKHSWSDEFLQKLRINLRPYEYQRELVQNAITASNTIICLRTGAGKTFVASLLIKYYLLKQISSSNGEPKKFLAFFIVPRRAMLAQQVEKAKQFADLRIAQCDEYVNLVEYTGKYDIIACTPQKLLNCLTSKTLSLSNIDLLCFDDCHDPASQNQYDGIMQYLLCTKVNSIPPVDRQPIIIGLTATIGSQRSTSSEISRNLTQLCARFNCSTVTTVSKFENKDELDRCVTYISDDEIICVERSKSYEELRSQIEEDLRDFILRLFLDKDTNPSQIFPDKDFDQNGYEQCLELLKRDEERARNASFGFLINYVLPIYRHFKPLSDLTPELVLSNLKNEHDSIYRKREHPMPIDTLIYEKCRSLLNEKLEELARSQEMISNPKLDKLAELVMAYAEKPENRILILVERTFYTHKICEFFKNHTQLKNIVKPCWLVGQNSTGSKRLNKKEDSVLQQFRNGPCNVLVSTDIIQTGLDLPSCSLVLRYDFVPDSIGSVQARVRARSTDCKYYLLTTNSSTNYLKEKDNHEREQNLQSALGAWKQLSPEEFKNQVLESKKCLIAEWTQNLIKAETTKLRNVKNTSLNGKIQCRCGYFLGKLDALRQRGQSYFISDFDFYNRIEEKNDDEPQEYGKTRVLGKALCGNKSCRAELGRIVTFKDHPQIPPIYPLKCASVRILRIDEETKKEEIISKKQWTAMPFEIVTFDDLDSVNNTEVFYDAYENFPQ